MEKVIALKQMKKMDFQMDNKNVLITCYIKEYNLENKVSYFISHSELNRIIGDIQNINPEENIYDKMQMVALKDGITLCTIDFEEFNLQNSYYPENYSFIFNETPTQICA